MATAATAQSGSTGAQGENTGRWTAEEHRLFLQGLEQHGKGWKKIASLIKSRTVVQIRTHAQKYFQKLAKARQNGEEGDIAMEGRGGTATVPSVTASAAQSSKRRRQTSGTKRKAIQSVVASAQRQGKKIATERAASGVPNPTAPLPAVAPALSHYVLPSQQPPHLDAGNTQPCVPSITTAQGTISGPALEDSLFRFLTPAPVAPSEPQVNEVARQAGANPITLPSDQPGAAPSWPSIVAGEVSPTGVADLSMYPSWTDAKDTPSWYAKGSDVDALLDVADTLDWLTDTGDLHESYQPEPDLDDDAASIPDDKPTHGLAYTPSVNNMSLNTLPRVDSADDVVVPPLPSLFDGATEAEEPSKRHGILHMIESVSTATIDEHLHVFDTPLEEHDFVSTILEDTGDHECLPVLS
jgi:SHAQKYF class myb-like DNA-binding protein